MPTVADPLISICIPTYREEGIIADTLAGLYTQSIIDKCEIIVGDYDPDNHQLIENIVKKFNRINKTYIRYIRIERPGIAYARHQCIMQSKGNIVINFDADAKFSKNDDLYQITRPLLIEKSAVLTCCNNVFYSSQAPTDIEKQKDMQFANMLMEFLCKTQNGQPIFAFLEPGSVIDKYVYIDVGGFNDLQRWELTDLSARIFYRYPFLKKHVNHVTVLVSPRRAINLRKYGLEILNYEFHYFDNKPKVKI